MAGSSGAKLRKSKTLQDCSHEDVVNLITELNKRYRNRDEKQGVFDSENPTVFHDTFKGFHSDSSDDSFIHFTHLSADNLRDRITNIASAKGGYLVYSIYEDYRSFCSVFFVRNTTSIAFKRNQTVDSFDLDKVQHIDFEKLAMACRINMTAFVEENKKYLSFIHNKRDEISKYFINWISTTDTVTSEEDTVNLLRALKTIPLPDFDDNDGQLTRDSVLEIAHRHIVASPTGNVNIRDLSKLIFLKEDYLPNFLFENDIIVPSDLKAHRPTLRRFVKIFAKADDIELRFPQKVYHDGLIRFDSKDPTQLIIKSKDLITEIRAGLGF